jgi:hypothetical protein
MNINMSMNTHRCEVAETEPEELAVPESAPEKREQEERKRKKTEQERRRKRTGGRVAQTKEN